MSRIERYLQELNGPQREAVLENTRPLLVLAGAGSGKTRVITTKIAYAVDALGLRPWEILAVTFTNKAANEMRSRVARMLDDVDVSEMQIRTFHSFGAWLLRRYGAKIGLNDSFTIYDDEDSLSLLASCFPESKKAELAPIAKAISLAKDMGLGPDSPELADFRWDRQFSRQFAAYEQKLRQVGNVDFADLIGLSIDLLAAHGDVAAALHRRFRMILVDEYQDSNMSQFSLLKALAGPDSFICVVGDDDQSIYRFRGAQVRNILSFPDVYPNTRIVKLEQNYRSSGNILAIASEVIAHNSGRHPKTLWTANGRGTASRLFYVADEKAEAMRVARILGKTGGYDDSAVLYRTNAQSVAFETVFSRLGIPYKVVGALRFYDREEVKDALALLYLVMNRNDVVNFRRMVNKPPRGLGEVSVDKVLQLAVSRRIDLIAALKAGTDEGLLTGKAASGARLFAGLFDEAERQLEEGNAACLEHLVTRSSLLEHYRLQDERNKTDKIDNLGTLISTVGEYPAGREGLGAFLESLMLDPTTIGRRDPSDMPGVTLITMHNTKGLEFDRVFITGLEEGLFPSRSCESEEDLEEERRIFYVAITRARRELYLFSCHRRMLWGRSSYQIPSRFLDEIPSRLIETEGFRPGASNDYSFVRRDEGYGGYGSLDAKRMGSGSFGSPGGKKGRNANILLKPVETLVPSAKPPAFESNGSPLYAPGDRVSHTSYGEGEVILVRMLRDRQVIDVRFLNGNAITFFSATAPLEKLTRD